MTPNGAGIKPISVHLLIFTLTKKWPVSGPSVWCSRRWVGGARDLEVSRFVNSAYDGRSRDHCNFCNFCNWVTKWRSCTPEQMHLFVTR